MSSFHFDAEAIMKTFPRVLEEDDQARALGQAFANLAEELHPDIDEAGIYYRIDELPEALCDILAYDFKVDWWDYEASLDEKRQTLKESFAIHRILGTKGALLRGINVVYPGSWVEEWFEYGGTAYRFRILIDVSDVRIESIPDSRIESLKKAAQFWKNARSHLDRITFRRVRDMKESVYFAASITVSRGMAKTAPEPEDGWELTFLVNELGQLLTDENGVLLTV